MPRGAGADRRPSSSRRSSARRPRARGSAAGGSTADDQPAEEIPGDPEQDLGDPEAVARVICLRLLNQRARSRSELADALARRGVPDDAAGVVLDRFTKVGLIDDTALAHDLAGAQHRDRGLARRAVADKLRRRGLDDETVRDALTDIDSDSERVQGAALVARRLRSLRGLEPQVQQRRLVGLLARKGYPPSMAYDLVRAAVAGAAADESDEYDGP